MYILKGFSRFVVLMSKMISFFNLSPLNNTVLRKVISFSDISAVDWMVGWNLWSHLQRVVTALYFSYFFSIFRCTCRKKAKEAKCLAQQSFPFQMRGEMEQANG